MVNEAFATLVGQTQAIELLTQAVKQDRIAPAYLFMGADGVGRSLAARCFVQLLFNCNESRITSGNHPDLLRVQPTYQHQGKILTPEEAQEKGLKRKAPPIIRLEQVREITDFLSRPPLSAPRHVVIVDGAETMAESAANALLKTLEEPGRATLILIAPSPESILTTLVSRCQKIPFYRLDTAGMAQVLQRAGHENILQHPTVLNIAAGSPGEAIASFEQMQAISPELLQSVTKVPATPRSALELAKQIDKALDTEAQLWLIDYLQQSYWLNFYQGDIVQALEQARKFLLCYAQPRLVWECTLLKIQKLHFK
ncbi:MAG: DNA polymerase III subunit delta' [Scytonematopsis contorta HA4267-MV1]|nr:DNA polymerase III subunit delta' [Scytonematopsis contorta HA4267-MV1]